MQPIKMQIPGISPGIYSLDYVIKQKSFIDGYKLHDITISKRKVKKRPVGRPVNPEKLSHKDACLKWRLTHPEKYRQLQDDWNAYRRALNGFRRLFGDDNKTIKHKTPKHPRNCLLCSTIGNTNSHICNMCVCNTAMAIT